MYAKLMSGSKKHNNIMYQLQPGKIYNYKVYYNKPLKHIQVPYTELINLIVVSPS